ncbi:MAG: hypothetical protein P4L51_20440 [Puia sp.]|nr:hypothetical protein [Puia sp.]
MKPYLIAALLFCVLRVWIATRVFYAPLTITLGEIQEKLSFIHSIPFVVWLTKHKALILLGYSILAVLLIAQAGMEAKAKKFKKYFSISLVWLSIFTNVSFFAAGIAGSVIHTRQELSQLQLEIVEIHNKIFVDAAVAVAIRPVDDYLSQVETVYNREAARIDEISQKQGNPSLDSSIVNPLIFDLARLVSQLRSENTLSVFSFDPFPPADNAWRADKLITVSPTDEAATTSTEAADNNSDGSPPAPEPHLKHAVAPEEAFLANYSKTIKEDQVDPAFESYFLHKTDWNKQEGTATLEQVDAVEAAAANTGNVTATKTKKILELLFSFGLDAGLDQLYEIFHIDPPKIFKKIASLVLEAGYKECAVGATVKLLGHIRKKIPLGKSFTADCEMQHSIVGEDGPALQQEDDDYVKNELQQMDVRKTVWQENMKKIEAEQKEAAAQAAKDLAAQKENERRMAKFHQKYGALEQKIREEIEAKDMGVPFDISRRMAAYIQQNRSNIYGKLAWRQILASPFYDRTLTLEENISRMVNGDDQITKSKVNRQLEDYFVPAIPVGSLKDYHNLLEGNYDLVRSQGSIKDIVNTVKTRDGISDAEAVK